MEDFREDFREKARVSIFSISQHDKGSWFLRHLSCQGAHPPQRTLLSYPIGILFLFLHCSSQISGSWFPFISKAGTEKLKPTRTSHVISKNEVDQVGNVTSRAPSLPHGTAAPWLQLVCHVGWRPKTTRCMLRVGDLKKKMKSGKNSVAGKIQFKGYLISTSCL